MKLLIFSSMGNRSDVLSSWLTTRSKKDLDLESELIDIWIYSYVNPDQQFQTLLNRVTYHDINQHASKFQNLVHAYKKYPERFQKYSHIAILDDDLIMNPSQIQEWFQIHQKYGLDISQPSFKSGAGLQVSWKCTQTQPDNILHYTTFIEMTAPMFSREILEKWLPDFYPYSSSLAGWGTDLFYMLTLDPFKKYRYGVIDRIIVSNPIRAESTGMKSLISKKDRKYQWELVRHKKGWTAPSYPILQSGHINTNGSPKYYKTPVLIENARLQTAAFKKLLAKKKINK